MALLSWNRNKNKMAFSFNRFLRSLVNSLQDANNACNGMYQEVITVCKQGKFKKALQMLYLIKHHDIPRDSSYTYYLLLQACVKKRALPEGKLIHAHIILTGFEPDIFLGTKLIVMYGKARSPADARQLLEELPERNVVSWTAVIAGYAQNGYFDKAVEMFYQMQDSGTDPNQFTYASVLPAFANLAALEEGKKIHQDIIGFGFQSNVFVSTALVDMYIKCECIEYARKLFDEMSERSLVSWNSMVVGYAQSGHVSEALELFRLMPERDVVSWTAMIAGYTQSGDYNEAMKFFREMRLVRVKINSDTYTSILLACANLGVLNSGREVHANIIRSGFQFNLFVGTALVDMYAKCGSIKEAQKVFTQMPERSLVSWNTSIAGYVQNGHVDEALELFKKMDSRNVVSWTAMIAGYTQDGLYDKALKLFGQMQLTGVKPDSNVFPCVLPACANLATLNAGKEVHEDIIRGGFHSNVFVGNSLINMYAKCGSIEDACRVFEKMPTRDVVSWTAMIVGYATHGYGKEALELFQQMQRFGTKPDHATFLGVLSACCHAGLVAEGQQYFDSMSLDYHIRPGLEHYSCMFDILCRAGLLDEAKEFINKMPVKPNAAVWGSLLGACIAHMNIEPGECVADHVLKLEPENAAHYVVLSNIYAAAGRWSDVEKVRKMMKERRIKSRPGCSWIEINNKVYAFVVGDSSKPETQNKMKKAVNVPNRNFMIDAKFMLHDVEDQQNEFISANVAGS